MKERFKSILLVVLLITNLILGSQVLSTEKLWSGDGYNFFVSIISTPSSLLKRIKQRIGRGKPTQTRLELPETIIINTGYQTTRHILNSSDKDFSTLLEIANTFLCNVLKRPDSFVKVESEQFNNALLAKSVYLRYPANYDSTLFAYLLGVGNGDFSNSFSQLTDIVIASNGYVYVKDSLTGSVYRCYSNVPLTELNTIISAHSEREYISSPIINYAFELGFDKAFGTQKNVLSPMIPIYSEGFLYETITARKLLISDNGFIDEIALSAILPYFSMNSNGLRRYTEVDGTVVFVENNAILKISPDGYIDYQAKDEGILLSKNALSINDSIAEIADFVDNVNISAGASSSMLVSSNLTSSELSEETLVITLDYLANGIPVKLSSGNAVTVSIKNGRIISYRHMIREFKTNTETVLVDDYIYALDSAISEFENQLNDIEINELKIIYRYDGKETVLLPKWDVSVKEIVING